MATSLAPAPTIGPAQAAGSRGLPGGLRAALVPAAAIALGASIGLRSPYLVLLAAVLAGLAALLRADGAITIFAFGFYLNLPVVAVQQTGAPPILASLLAVVLILPFIGYLVIGRQPLVISTALGLMVAFLFAQVLSATLAPGAGAQTQTPVITFLTEGLLLFLLVTNVVRTPRTLRLVIWAVVLACGVMGLISAWQELTHSYSNHLFGLASVDASGFNVGSEVSGKDLRPRLAGPIGEKNRYAQVLLVMLPLSLYLLRTEALRWQRLLALACGVLTLTGVLLTFSRGAAIALLLTVIVMVFIGFVRLRYIAALVLAVVGMALVIAPDYVTRLQSLGEADTALSEDSTADGAVVGRATENLAAYHAFADHPIIGVGPEQYFRQYSQEYANQLNLRFLEKNRRAHNLYLEIAADLGIIGLGIFLTLVGVTLRGLWKMNLLWRERKPEYSQMALALFLGVTAYMASGIFLQLSYQRYFFFLLALANAAIWVLRREALRARLIA